ncbi:MAG TPA: S9 family peptidase [Acidobacteriota bacterium]|nr:S9 family peptidase [Acidobacteriota bacterium]HQF88566.1 S9 family peptidase [Acidobacteriota bacterium]HQG93129.1 S9 family peptidase [Acidobacteriota bacterium]HQK87352.1 S9 family peptidase [Acidobacteriota bacterium]
MRDFRPRGRHLTVVVLGLLLAGLTAGAFAAPAALSPGDMCRLRSVTEARISPDGKWIAAVVSRQREAGDAPGGNYAELHVWSVETGQARPFITGQVAVSAPEWSPDGRLIAFLLKRGDDAKTQIWTIPADGGEAAPATQSATDVLAFRWHPDGSRLAYVAQPSPTAREQELEKKGYNFIYFEENLKPRALHLVGLPAGGVFPEPVLLVGDLSVWDFCFSPDGARIALAATERNLVDHMYMFQKIYRLELADRALTPWVDPDGKLGRLAFSPDGAKLAYTAAAERKDHAESQVYVVAQGERTPRNLTPPDFAGHVAWAGWQDADTVLYLAGEGVSQTLSAVAWRGGERRLLLDGAACGLVFGAPHAARDGRVMAMTGHAAAHPTELFVWTGTGEPRRLSWSNPWLPERTLGRQEVIRYAARDGRSIEGLLVHPTAEEPSRKPPLVVVVHGGPEAHYANGWLTRYSEPVQVLAGMGYLVFLPNYRASTGYGVAFAAEGYGDPAGKEFDDIADGIDHLVCAGMADAGRVGLIGGSYGGYAAAWFASYYTRYVRAVCMFVGISDLVSKRGTTDIPYEELQVHSGKPLEQMWELALQRSPLYHAAKSRTAVLIIGGAQDTRVHPSQSLEFYRQLKMTGHPAVRLVQYPGEGHGNRKQPGRIDTLLRQLDWLDWYVRDLKPLDGPLPPLDLSDRYGLTLPDR